MGPTKIDGFGVRIAGATTTANAENRTRFVSMYASEALEKGHAVAFDFKDTEPEPGGYGNTVCKVDSNAAHTDGDRRSMAVGIAAEATPSGFPTGATDEKDVIITVQVGGICDYAQITALSVTESGDPLCASNEPGELKLIAADEELIVALHVKDGTDGAADSTVFLLNPANL
mgnify:FL=1